MLTARFLVPPAGCQAIIKKHFPKLPCSRQKEVATAQVRDLLRVTRPFNRTVTVKSARCPLELVKLKARCAGYAPLGGQGDRSALMRSVAGVPAPRSTSLLRPPDFARIHHFLGVSSLHRRSSKSLSSPTYLAATVLRFVRQSGTPNIRLILAPRPTRISICCLRRSQSYHSFIWYYLYYICPLCQ